jgi:hypothetical protein
MLAKVTSKNQLTLPKALMSRFPGTEYFEVSEEGGRIILTPTEVGRGDAVRAKLAALGVQEKDVADAVKWARKRR